MPPKKQRTHINKLWFLIFEIVGLGLSIFLFMVSVGIVNIPCPRQSIFACTGVVRGPFSHVGPLSVAAMGVVYFVCQLMLTAGLRERTAQILKGLSVFGGVFFIAWLRGLELIYTREICPWCWGVALVTLIHAGITYTIVSPPLPKLRPAGIAATIFGGFIVLIGLVSVLELSFGFGKIVQKYNTSNEIVSAGKSSSVPIASPGSEKQPEKSPTAKSTPVPSKPKDTPAPKPSPTPAPPAAVATSTPAPTSTATPTVTVTPMPDPTPPPTFDPEPKVEDSEEVRILRKRGWRHAGSGASVVKAVKVQPPVLMLAYDPHCSDCHRLITQTLDNDLMNGLRVTRICIQESMLSGQLNDMVKALPTVLLFDENGSVIMKQVGSRITTKEFVAKINQALGK